MSSFPKPTFFLLGAAKSGTTSVAQTLALHSQIFFSTPKEPIFFEAQYSRGLKYYAEEYLRGWSGEPAVGDGRVYNLYLPYVPERIHSSLPEARLIVILRNPIDRAYSHWWHRVTRGYERREFDQVVEDEIPLLERGNRFSLRENEADWLNNFYSVDPAAWTVDLREVPYLELGYYSEQLRRYRNLFPDTHLKVFLMEDLVSCPDWILRNIANLLNVGPFGNIEFSRRNVARSRVKGRLAFEIEKLGWSIGLAKFFPKEFRARVRSLFPQVSTSRPILKPHIRSLLASHYQPWNAELSHMLGRDLRTWSGVSDDHYIS